MSDPAVTPADLRDGGDRNAGGSHGSGRHWFEDLADHLGPAYLRYSFTMGTTQEVDFLIDALDLAPGDRVLDVGCGPGRHALEFARRGIRCVGVDISERFVEVAGAQAEAESLADLTVFVRGDARSLGAVPAVASVAAEGGFDAAVSLCQGAFGLGGPPRSDDPQNLAADAAVLHGVRSALRPGGAVAVSAFSSYFQVRWLEDHDAFDAAGAVNHEHTEVRDPAGSIAPAELWTTCYTPRELRLLSERVGLVVDDIWSVSPGEYRATRPTPDSHEFLLRAHRAD